MKKIIICILCFLSNLFISGCTISDISHYNDGYQSFKSGSLDTAENIFSSLSGSTLSSKSLHNLGNIEYIKGLQEKDTEKQKSLWQKSLGYYSGALSLEKNNNTQENYDFVVKKLQENQQKQDKEKQDTKESTSTGSNNQEKQNESTSGSGQTNDGTGKVDEKKSGGSTPTNKAPYKIDGDSKIDALSDAEKHYLEAYQAHLKQEQNQNQGYYNKKEPENGNPFSNILDPFTGKPLFQDGTDTTEKDW